MINRIFNAIRNYAFIHIDESNQEKIVNLLEYFG